METRANYALIGAFVLIAGFAIAGFVMWLGQSQFRQDFKAYDIVFEGPVSLEEGSAVRYIGIKVGEVSTVRIDRADPSKVRARIRIDRETPIKQDSTASIQLAGITGITFIQLTAGTGKSLEARAGEPVPVIRAERTQLDQLFSGGTEVLGNANRAIQRVNLILTDENIDALATSLRNIETISTKLAARDGLVDQASTTLADMSSASNRFEAASASLEKVGTTADARIAGFADQMDMLVGDVRSVAQSARDTISTSNRAVSAAADAIEGPATEAIQDARLASQDLRVLINRLDRIAREVEQNPQGFVVGDPIPYEGGRR
ncbi:MlaD family protein [Hyphomonas sp.]|uniref:MlaD family protein n=1 Tax=Hyphomonas sp. TaxID=87 RepID=UPI0032F08CF5|tara:strand:- start:2000 stop:2956 length:957 start_codon:yes stop_codon:yes gene_type:complete